MGMQSLKAKILFLLLMSVGSSLLSAQIPFEDDTQTFCFFEEVAEFDEVEGSSEFEVVATIQPIFGLYQTAGFHAITDEVNHQIDWLFVHERSARAPPLG